MNRWPSAIRFVAANHEGKEFVLVQEGAGTISKLQGRISIFCFNVPRPDIVPFIVKSDKATVAVQEKYVFSVYNCRR